MKTVLLISFLFMAFQASAATYDNSGKISYDLDEVQIIVSCDATTAKVSGWYVLGTINYGEPMLFFNTRGKLTPARKQTNRWHSV